MSTTLRHRKARRRRIDDSRGFGSIVGAIFAVLVIISLVAAVFIFSISQNNLYNNAVRTKNQLDAEQSSEIINAFNASYVVSGNTVSVSAPIQNLGYLPLQITRLWLRDINVTGLYNVSPLLTDYSNIAAGAHATIKADILMTGVQANHNFTSWLITGRGNVFATSTSLFGPKGDKGDPGESGQSSMVSQGIGSLAMNFSLFWHYDLTLTGSQTKPSDGTALPLMSSDNYTIRMGSGKCYTVFHVVLANYDPIKEIIWLNQNSSILMLGQSAMTVKWTSFGLVNVTNGKIYPSQSNFKICLPLTQQVDLYFGGTVTQIDTGYVYPLNILPYGTKGGKPYGQNIPFVSVYLAP